MDEYPGVPTLSSLNRQPEQPNYLKYLSEELSHKTRRVVYNSIWGAILPALSTIMGLGYISDVHHDRPGWAALELAAAYLFAKDSYHLWKKEFPKALKERRDAKSALLNAREQDSLERRVEE